MANRKAFLWLSLGMALLVLGACASHTWAPGPDAKGTFEEASARCSLVARHSGGGFYAQGTPSFVAGAAVGAAVGDAVRAQADFNDCMAANGWVVADPDSSNVARKQAANNQVAAIRSQLSSCIEAVRNNPKYAPLAPHLVNIASGHYSLTQMSDSGRPTEQEAGLLASYGDETATCRGQTVVQISAMDPRAGQTLQRINAEVRDLDLALINRQITWGDYARQCQDVFESGGTHPSLATANDTPSAPADAPKFQNFDAWQQSAHPAGETNK